MVRTGKPWSIGSGWPFIATASIALRSSVGRPAGCRRSSRRRRSGARRPRRPGRRPSAAGRASRTPLHQALPIRSPPTSLDTQLSVIHASVRSPGEQLVVGQHQLAVDHAVDPQRPVPRLDRRAPRSRCGSGRSRRSASATATMPVDARPATPCGTSAPVTPGSRSSRRVSSTCRRPRADHPADARDERPTPAVSTPARIRNPRRVGDLPASAPRRLAPAPRPPPAASASSARRSGSVSSDRQISQVAKPTASGR